MAGVNGYLATANDTYTAGGAGNPADLLAIVVGTAAASAVVTVYNGSSTSGAVMATIDASAINFFEFGDDGMHCPAGLFVKLTGGNAKVTVVAQ
jgi:hypothetical protein